MQDNIKRTTPLLLSVIIILLDQLSKSFVIKNIPVGTIYASFFGDFLRIIHVTNLGAAFSIGNDLSGAWRFISLCIIPLAVLILVLIAFFVAKELSQVQRWFVAGILGGGFGNLIDRFFRPAGVVDFIDVKFYGLFGLERWPTFNLADSAVLVCEIALVISFIISIPAGSEKNKASV
ncbi:MAG: signal peptidase II [Spirochaetaceae bacterium]|nr:signal peptidase II [Spirochaetaceae bacterium]